MSHLSQDASLASTGGAVPYHHTYKGDKCKARLKNSSRDARSSMEDLQQCFSAFLLHLLKHVCKCKVNKDNSLDSFLYVINVNLYLMAVFQQAKERG